MKVNKKLQAYSRVVENEVKRDGFNTLGKHFRDILYWIQHNADRDSRFVGFDTFTGLPEDWGLTKKGSFSTNGLLPSVNDGRCFFVKGLFQNTLGEWLKSANLSRRLVVHLDADLYSSTSYVLTKLEYIRWSLTLFNA